MTHTTTGLDWRAKDGGRLFLGSQLNVVGGLERRWPKQKLGGTRTAIRCCTMSVPLLASRVQ